MIRSGITHSAKLEFLQGKHRPGHIYRCALFIKGTKLGPDTTNFGPELADFEVVGQGYEPGGKPLHNVHYGLDGKTAFMSFDNLVWHDATFTARGCLIYNDSLPGRPAVFVLNFQADKSADRGDFTIMVPKADAKTAAIRFS